MNLADVNIRPATLEDAVAVQELRKNAWRARYANPDSGVTQDLIETKLAVLPLTSQAINYYDAMLDKIENRGKNLVAVMGGRVIGTVIYDDLSDATGDIGVFVADEYNGQGVGDKLLDRLVGDTTNSLQVIIFAKNPSREFYKRHGFVEEGAEKKHFFDDKVYLPTQKLVLKR
jgi:GNAT superfamily N-acetyltransferase